MQFEVGMELYFVPSDPRRSSKHFVKVSKVGRKWVNLENGYRFDKVDLWVDGNGYSSPGRVYLSQEEYDRQCKKESAIRAIHERTAPWVTTENLTLGDILAAAKLLKVPGYE